MFVCLTLQLVSITFARTGATMNTLDGWVIKQKALSDDEELGVYEAKRPRVASPTPSAASASEATVPAEPVHVSRVTKKQFNRTAAGFTGTPKPKHALLFSEVVEAAATKLGGVDALFQIRGAAMAGLSHNVRGPNAERVVQRFLAQNGVATHDVDCNNDAPERNGVVRSKTKTTYDFGIALHDDGAVQKGEHKLARISYVPARRCWSCVWSQLKLDLSDIVLLTIEALDGLHVFQWDKEAQPGISRDGKMTASNGGQVVVVGSRGTTNPDEATSEIVQKMKKVGNTYLGKIPYTDESYRDLFLRNTKGGKEYADVPMGTLTCTTRGNALDRVAQAVLARWLGATIAPAPASTNCRGGKVGAHSTEADFLCNEQRAEHKMSILCWDVANRRWKLQFAGIRHGLFDVLYLSMYTPRGIHIFETTYAHVAPYLESLNKHGESRLSLNAPGGKGGYGKASAAEAFLVKNLAALGVNSYHFTYLAFVKFAEGDEERLRTEVERLANSEEDAEEDLGVEGEESEEGEEEGEGEAEGEEAALRKAPSSSSDRLPSREDSDLE